MTALAFYPGNLQWLAIAPETTYGTAAVAPLYWIPVDSPQWTPNITQIVDQSLRGVMATDHQQQSGSRYDTLTYKTYVYSDTAYLHFLAMLGGADTLTGSADPYTHKTSLYNGSGTDAAQPRSFTAWLYTAAGKCVLFTGMQMTDLKLTDTIDTLPTLDVAWDSLAATFVTPVTNTPGVVQPMAAWTSVITVAGSAVNQYSDFEIDLKRGTKPINTLTGVQSTTAIYAGELSVTGTMKSVYAGPVADVDLLGYIGNTQPAITCTMNAPSDATHTLAFQMSKIAYDSVVPTGGMSGWMENAITFKALTNATDPISGSISPIRVTQLSTRSTSF